MRNEHADAASDIEDPVIRLWINGGYNLHCPLLDIHRNSLSKAVDACIEYALLIEIV